MCVVSMITDSFMKRWPEPSHLPYYDYTILKDLIRKAEEYDKMTKQPECPEPAKVDWLEKVREQLERRKQEGSYKWIPNSNITLNQWQSTLAPVNLWSMPPAANR